jgi:hypothetical protein
MSKSRHVALVLSRSSAFGIFGYAIQMLKETVWEVRQWAPLDRGQGHFGLSWCFLVLCFLLPLARFPLQCLPSDLTSLLQTESERRLFVTDQQGPGQVVCVEGNKPIHFY